MDGLSDLRTTSWTLTQVGFEGCRPSALYFADEYARRTVGLPSPTHVPDIAAALRAVQAILPKLEVKMIEFLCGNIRYFWLVSEESFWLCAYLDERDEVVQCASSALVGRAYSALENSMLAFFEEAIWNS